VITIESAHKKGVPLTVIARRVQPQQRAVNVLIVAKNSPLRTARSQWQGRGDKSAARIGEVLTDAWVDKNAAIHRPSSTSRCLRGSGRVVEQGRADATLSVEPFITQSKNDTRFFSNIMDALGDGYLITLLYIEFVGQAIPRWSPLRGCHSRSRRLANANPAKSAEILAKYGKLDPAMVKQTVRARYATTLNAGQFNRPSTHRPLQDLRRFVPAQELIFTPK